jgi:hypothetical protein
MWVQTYSVKRSNGRRQEQQGALNEMRNSDW